MSSSDYKVLHEEFVTNHEGTTMVESYLLFTIVPMSVFQALCVTTAFKNNFSLAVEFIIIVIPLLLCTTLLSDYIHFVSSLMALVCSLLAVYYIRNFTYHDFSSWLSNKSGKLPYVTNYRGSLNLISSLCILAVDFKIYPRRFAKTETFGFGVMDLGVGSFIFASGVVNHQATTPVSFIKTLKSTVPLIALGLIRLLSVKATNYHEHITEYGIHWNFFFTLAFCKLFSFLIVSMLPFKNLTVIAIFTAIAHQIAISFFFQEWVLQNHPRNNFLSANREGITSLLGYVSLYLGSISLKPWIQKKDSPKNQIISLLKLVVLNTCLWILTKILSNSIGVSRCLANLGYTVWVTAFNLTTICHFIIVDLFFYLVICQLNKSRKRDYIVKNVPFLLDSINENGLFYFLLSNVLTGIVNLSCQTIYIGPFFSIVILFLYLLITCMIMMILYWKHIKLKF